MNPMIAILLGLGQSPVACDAHVVTDVVRAETIAYQCVEKPRATPAPRPDAKPRQD